MLARMAVCFNVCHFIAPPNFFWSSSRRQLRIAGGVAIGNGGAESAIPGNAKNQQDLGDASRGFTSMGKESASTPTDVIKLFNEVQQNMLCLNEQRISAVEELENVQREKELLAARVCLLEVEAEASKAECEVMRRQLEAYKLKAGGRSVGIHGTPWAVDTPLIYGELLLRIDSMVLTNAISSTQARLLKSLVLNKDIHAFRVFSSQRMKDDKELASSLLQLLDPKRRSGLHVIHICTELDPIVSSSTVGSRVINLSKALQNCGNLVEAILPKYSTINMDEMQSVREISTEFYSFFGGQWHKNKIWTGIVHGIPVTLIESFHPGGFFDRENLYGYSDDFERFSYFCRASLDYMVTSGKQPDILHLYNWQTALVAPLFWDIFVKKDLKGVHILLNCSDFKNQCLGEPAKLSLCGLDPQQLHRADRLQDNVQPRLVNILKGGIVYSNKVTTTSPVYALDAMTREHGNGLEPTILAHKKKFIGIYDGVNKSVWDPKTDQFLPSTFSLDYLSGKAYCKAHLKQQVGLAKLGASAPLIGCIAKQVSEADVELMKAALNCAKVKQSQLVFVGESKSPHVQAFVKHLESGYEEKHGAAILEFTEATTHKVLAASDILLCISMHEPTMPLIAMQYGSIPVTKQQEGSDEKVIDVDLAFQLMQPNAFTFRSSMPHEVGVALSRAIECLKRDPQKWHILIQNGMKRDFSWDSACVEEYMAAYWAIKQL